MERRLGSEFNGFSRQAANEGLLSGTIGVAVSVGFPDGWATR